MTWSRACAAVFTSYLFFLASCTAGMAGVAALSSDDYGRAVTVERPASGLVALIATVPDTERPGERKAVMTLLGNLDKFKKENPNCSFLLAPGAGQVENAPAEMTTSYVSMANGPGKAIVKTEFHHDVPPFPWGLNVRARYEATEHDVRILNANVGYMEVAFMCGLVFASGLAVVGNVLKWRQRRTQTL